MLMDVHTVRQVAIQDRRINMNFVQINETGSRIVGALTLLGHVGPKHPAVIIGKNIFDGNIYVAESRYTGYELTTYGDFMKRFLPYGDVRIYKNDGQYSDREVAQRALAELKNGGNGRYNLIVNNCESFSNRAMYDDSRSAQIINTAMGVLMLASAYLILTRAK